MKKIMTKRIIASTLAVMLGLSLLPYEILANLQSPVEGISGNSIVGHTTLPGTEGLIRPEVELIFDPPTPSGSPDSGAGEGANPTRHDPEHYQVHINEYQGNKSFKAPESPNGLLGVINADKNQRIKVQDHTTQLENGKLYRMSVIPSHDHTYTAGDQTITRPAPHTIPISSQPYKYVLTDFNTTIKGGKDSIEITWEDSGYDGMKYMIGYKQGDYAGKSLDEMGQNIEYVRPEPEKYKDSDGKDRLRYTIKNGIVGNQMYSAFVVAETVAIGGDVILKNDTTPKVVTDTTEIELKVFNIGNDKIRLEWNAQSTYVMEGGSYKLEKVDIKEYALGDSAGRVITTLHGDKGAGIGYYEYREPKENTYYQLIFTYRDGAKVIMPETEKVLYVPGQLRIKPTTPVIPRPIGPNIVPTDENKQEFFLPNDTIPDGPLIDLWKSDHTFHANMVTPPNLNFVWSAYQQDLSLLYDIWVTDDLDILQSDARPIVPDLSFSEEDDDGDILRNQSNGDIVGFKHTIREYYNSDMSKLPLVPNKVYYVKIVAKKSYGEEYERSLPAIVTIMFDSDGEVFAPPIISKPPLRLEPEGIGTTSVTIGWLESWYEILALKPENFPDEQEKAKQWNAKVYTTTGSAISFTNKVGSREHILRRLEDVNVIKGLVGGTYYNENFIDRSVNLGRNVKYEYKFKPYEEILQGLEDYNRVTSDKKTVEQYIEMLMKNETDPEEDYGWKDITPTNAQDEDYINWKQHTEENLKPNTSYVFFVKPYSNDYDGTKLQAALPTWIVVTTLPDGDMPEGKPTVPILSLNGKGDSHISVEWEYNSEFDYEIRYSRLDDPDKATPWPFEIGTEVDDPTYVENGGKAIVTINGLFPDTRYNVWIRAKQKKGQQISSWSNPVTTKTDILGAPTSPQGLGVASYQSILEVGKDFTPVGDNYITVEWQRIGPDKDLDDIVQDSQRVQKEYQYVIEIADNPEFIDVERVTVSKDTVGKKEGNAEVLSRNMVYFDGLIANRPYYIRAKTVLIADDKESNRQIILESDYTQFVRIITKPSEDEYDGGDKTNEVIFPDKIKEHYDGTTWTYEILDTQRVISEMVTENQFRYVVPMQKYRSQHNPKYRVIKIPQPVIKTLINRRMELEIRTHILTMMIPAQALEAALIDSSSKDMVELVFETLSPSDLYGLGLGYEYSLLSTPEKMRITLKGQKGIFPLNRVDALMRVKINMPHQQDYMYKNLGGYTYDDYVGTWKKGNHTFDKVNMQLDYTSGAIGTYAVYELSRISPQMPTMNQSMSSVLRNHDILGLGSKYTSQMQVKTPEYINIMLGLAEKREMIIPDNNPTREEIERARRSGLYIANTTSGLTQEAAISGLVRLYELTNGAAIRPQTNSTVNGVSNMYQNNIRKAYTIGLIDNISPRASMTYGEFFNLIEQVIE